MGEGEGRREEPAVTPVVESEASRAPDGMCESCHERPGEPVELERVTSYLVLTDVKQIRGTWCPDCARKNALKELLWSTTLGWWGVPLGILAGRAIARNLKAMSRAGKAPPAVVGTFGVASILVPAVLLFSIVAGINYLSYRGEEAEIIPPEYFQEIGTAHLAFRAGGNRKAIEHYERAESIYDRDHELFGNKALALHYVGRTEEAVEALQRALELWAIQDRTETRGPRRHSVYLLWLGQFQKQLGDVESAEKIFELTYGGNDKAALYISYADLLANQARYDDALRVLETGLAFKSDSADEIDEPFSILEKKIDVLLQKGDLAAADSVLMQIQPSTPDTAEHLTVWNPLGSYRAVRLAQGRLDELREVFARLSESLDQKIAGLVAERQPEGAKSQFETVLRFTLARVLSLRAELEPEIEKREELLEKGLAMTDHGSQECRIGRIGTLIFQDRLDEALGELEEVITPENVVPDIELLKFHALLLARRYDDAAAWVDHLVRAYPGRGDVQNARAIVVALTRSEEEAQEALAEGRARLKGNPGNPGNPRAQRDLLTTEGFLLLHWGRRKEAAERFRDATEVYPDPMAEVRLQAARAFLDAGEHAKADWSFIDEPSPALRHRTVATMGRLWRGVADAEIGKDPSADWTAVAGADPRSFTDDFGWLAVLAARLLTGRIDQAAYEAGTKSIQHVLRDDRDFVKAFALERAGKKEEAAAIYSQILARPGVADMPRGLTRRRLEAR